LSSAEYSAKLSAREQEHIARITGQPLVSIANKPNQSGASEAGLIGAIGARERERAQMKKGLNSQAVETAIAMRQQELMAQQQQQQQQQAQMQGYQQYPTQYYDQSGAQFLQRPQSWAPNMNAFAAGGGGWSTASQYAGATDGGSNAPPQYPGGSNQQYSGYTQQGQGRGGQQNYYGQGY
jgi:CCR4-NOT transcriptional complex subunit CAF120